MTQTHKNVTIHNPILPIHIRPTKRYGALSNWFFFSINGANMQEISALNKFYHSEELNLQQQ
jgi:hypothetical protein